jgi:hypothetical protein
MHTYTSIPAGDGTTSMENSAELSALVSGLRALWIARVSDRDSAHCEILSADLVRRTVRSWYAADDYLFAVLALKSRTISGELLSGGSYYTIYSMTLELSVVYRRLQVYDYLITLEQEVCGCLRIFRGKY